MTTALTISLSFYWNNKLRRKLVGTSSLFTHLLCYVPTILSSIEWNDSSRRNESCLFMYVRVCLAEIAWLIRRSYPLFHSHCGNLPIYLWFSFLAAIQSWSSLFACAALVQHSYPHVILRTLSTIKLRAFDGNPKIGQKSRHTPRSKLTFTHPQTASSHFLLFSTTH